MEKLAEDFIHYLTVERGLAKTLWSLTIVISVVICSFEEEQDQYNRRGGS